MRCRALSTLRGRANIAKSKLAFAREFPEDVVLPAGELARAKAALQAVVAERTSGKKAAPRTAPAQKRVKRRGPKVKRGQKHR